ncbi:hypothetical protein [Helicobacter felis]|uniref:hypothetical protein n=1 Tax=Helicobacter felis TaxID=214 RepID=UPI000CF06D57|nr:hypothetical protein [Helicobacter felis]
MSALSDVVQELGLKAGQASQELTQAGSQALKNANEAMPGGTKALIATEPEENKDQTSARDFSPYIINDEDLAQPAPQGPSAPPSTGIKELDDKIAKRQLSMFDYYLAHNHLGLDLGGFLGGGLELKQKIANRTKATADVYETIRALDLGDNIINKAQENSGKLSGLARKLNQITGGLIPLSAELAQTDTAVNQYTYSTARAFTGGRVTDQVLGDLKHITRFALRGAKENTARLGETQNINLNYLINSMRNLQALGGNITPDMLAKLQEYKAKARYIQEKGGDIDIKEYNALRKGRE